MGIPSYVSLGAETFASGTVTPVSLNSPWVQANWQSVGTAVTPTAVPTAASWSGSGWATYRVLTREQGRGTTLRVRLLYDAQTGSATVTQNPKYRVYGRKRPVDAATLASSVNAYEWELLPNRNGDVDALLTCVVASDIQIADGGTNMFASVSDFAVNSHDCNGCDDFIVMVTTALTQGGGGVVTKAILQAKII